MTEEEKRKWYKQCSEGGRRNNWNRAEEERGEVIERAKAGYSTKQVLTPWMSVLQEPKWIPFLSQRWTLYLLLCMSLSSPSLSHTHAHIYTHTYINGVLSILKRAEEYFHSRHHLVNSVLMGLVCLQCVTVHWAAVISPCFTMEKPSTVLRWKMGQGLLFHAQLDVLMVNHAEFMCYSMTDYNWNWPLWKFPRHGVPLAYQAMVSLSLSFYLSVPLPSFHTMFSVFLSLYLLNFPSPLWRGNTEHALLLWAKHFVFWL